MQLERTALAHSVWLLTQLPIAARSADFAGQLSALGLRIGKSPTLLEVVSAFADAVDWHAARTGGRTDLGEIAQQAAAESFTAIVGRSLPSLFSPTPEEVQKAFGRLTSRDNYGDLAREFFARLSRPRMLAMLAERCRGVIRSMRFGIDARVSLYL